MFRKTLIHDKRQIWEIFDHLDFFGLIKIASSADKHVTNLPSHINPGALCHF
jgi:hypothetical protein